MVFTEGGIIKEPLTLLMPEKAPLLMVVTELGIVKSVTFLISRNASSPMVFTDFPIVNFVTPLMILKALFH